MNDPQRRKRRRKADVIGEAGCLGGHLHDTKNSDELQQSSDADATREERIGALSHRLVLAKTPDERRKIWAEFSLEVNSRSLAQVRRLEIKRGLRAA